MASDIIARVCHSDIIARVCHSDIIARVCHSDIIAEYVIVISLLELCQPNFRFKRWVGHLELISCTLKLL